MTRGKQLWLLPIIVCCALYSGLAQSMGEKDKPTRTWKPFEVNSKPITLQEAQRLVARGTSTSLNTVLEQLLLNGWEINNLVDESWTENTREISQILEPLYEHLESSSQALSGAAQGSTEYNKLARRIKEIEKRIGQVKVGLFPHLRETLTRIDERHQKATEEYMKSLFSLSSADIFEEDYKKLEKKVQRLAQQVEAIGKERTHALASIERFMQATEDLEYEEFMKKIRKVLRLTPSQLEELPSYAIVNWLVFRGLPIPPLDFIKHARATHRSRLIIALLTNNDHIAEQVIQAYDKDTQENMEDAFLLAAVQDKTYLIRKMLAAAHSHPEALDAAVIAEGLVRAALAGNIKTFQTILEDAAELRSDVDIAASFNRALIAAAVQGHGPMVQKIIDLAYNKGLTLDIDAALAHIERILEQTRVRHLDLNSLLGQSITLSESRRKELENIAALFRSYRAALQPEQSTSGLPTPSLERHMSVPGQGL